MRVCADKANPRIKEIGLEVQNECVVKIEAGDLLTGGEVTAKGATAWDRNDINGAGCTGKMVP